jgi:peroxiredoxin
MAALISAAAFAQDDIGLPVGALAPDFTEADYNGEKVTLSELYEDHRVVLIFYRGGWCPYCTRQLKSYQDHIDQFDALGVKVVAVSVDTQQKAAQTAAEYDIGFILVSNPQADTIHDYHLVYYVPDDVNEKYLNEYHIDLEGASGRTDHLLAVPATFVIEKGGAISFASANVDYKQRVSVEEVLEFLRIAPVPTAQ